MKTLYIVFAMMLSLYSAAYTADRLPVPDDEQQKDALELLKEVFGKEMESRDATVQLKLAGTMLRQADDPANDAATRYVLLMHAAKLAAENGDASTALKAVDKLGQMYKAKTGQIELKVLETTAREAKTPEEYAPVAKAYLQLAKKSVDNDEYDIADEAAREAYTAARKAKDVKLTQAAKEMRERVSDAEKAYRDVAEAKEKLKAAPEDPAANGIVGRHLCFNKNEWDEGLPLLAKAEDKDLAAAAKTELNEPAETESQVVLGDAWFALAEKEKDELAKSALMSRAKRQYEKALQELGGIMKIKIQKQITEASKSIKPVHQVVATTPGPTGSDGAASTQANSIEKIPGLVLYVPFNRSDIEGRRLKYRNHGREMTMAVSGGTLQLTKRGRDDAVTIDATTFVFTGGWRMPEGAAPRTTAIWMRYRPPVNVNRAAYAPVLSCGKSQGNEDWTISLHPNFTRFSCGGTGLSYGAVKPTDGQWHHLAFTYDGAEARAYFDGRLCNRGQITAQVQGNMIMIGRHLSGSTRAAKFIGDVDEVCVFDRALSAEEIATLASQTGGTVTASATQPEATPANEQAEEPAPEVSYGKAVDLLREYRKNHWTNLVPDNGDWQRGRGEYRMVGAAGGGLDFGWSWPLPEGVRRFRVRMRFRMLQRGAVQIVFTESTSVFYGNGVSLCDNYNRGKQYTGFTAGDLGRLYRSNVRKLPLPDDLDKGRHTLVIEVDANAGITATLDEDKTVSWQGQFNPTCVRLLGDEFTDWYVNDLLFEPAE